MNNVKPIKKILIFGVLFLVVFSLSAQQYDTSKLKPGDLLFQDLDCGPLCEAIEKVTQGYRGASFSHNGLVDTTMTGKYIVLEAVSEGVVTTPIDRFLTRSLDDQGNPKVIVGRLKSPYRHLIRKALNEAYTLVGKPYDKIYEMGDSAYYCSEMMYEVFKRANGGKPFFKTYPMTFKDPDTRQLFPAWEAYYNELDEPVPEGKPGLNPGSMSRSDKIEIILKFGKPDHYN